MTRPAPDPTRSEPTRPAARREALLVGVSLIGYTLLLGVALSAAKPPADGDDDPVGAELARLSAFVASTDSSDALWLDVKGVAAPTLERALAALREGRRLLAVQRLAAARIHLAAAAYMLEHIASGAHDEAAFEAAWQQQREALGSAPVPADLQAVRPVAVRALAESALYEAPILHATSLLYGRATEPEIGLFYVGQARAQLEFAALCRALPPEAGAPFAARPEPALRDLSAELDALEAEVLVAYRPPASIDRHPEFITVGSYLKSAREMNAAGLRPGALLAYLHAAMRFAPLRAAGAVPGAGPDARAESPPDAPRLAAALEAAAARFAADAHDQSLGALFVETGQADLADTAGPTPADAPAAPQLARAIVDDVLPRYEAALRPAPAARPAAPRPPAEVVVTLVRWPFT